MTRPDPIHRDTTDTTDTTGPGPARHDTTSRPDPGRERGLLRFTLAARWVHRSTAALMGTCLATAAILYIPSLSVAVGRRPLVEDVHVYAGIALPVPALAGLLSRALRADYGRLNRFTPDDWRWLRARDRRSGRIPVGKFNAGQKLNSAFVAGAIAVLLGTGLIMRFADAWPVSWRTGATFVHDWLSTATFVVVAGHLWFAWNDPEARRGMRTGWVTRGWARREHARWVAESDSTDQGVTSSTVNGGDSEAP
jgi:formate dehydrogenase subunit gamma